MAIVAVRTVAAAHRSGDHDGIYVCSLRTVYRPLVTAAARLGRSWAITTKTLTG